MSKGKLLAHTGIIGLVRVLLPFLSERSIVLLGFWDVSLITSFVHTSVADVGLPRHVGSYSEALSVESNERGCKESFTAVRGRFA
jgi:hypothetical protein